MIAEQFVSIIRVAEELNLQALIVVEGSQQHRDLLLKFIQFRNLRVGQVRRLKDEAFGNVSVVGKSVEDNQVAKEKPVGRFLKHGELSRGV